MIRTDISKSRWVWSLLFGLAMAALPAKSVEAQYVYDRYCGTSLVVVCSSVSLDVTPFGSHSLFTLTARNLSGTIVDDETAAIGSALWGFWIRGVGSATGLSVGTLGLVGSQGPRPDAWELLDDGVSGEVGILFGAEDALGQGGGLIRGCAEPDFGLPDYFSYFITCGTSGSTGAVRFTFEGVLAGGLGLRWSTQTGAPDFDVVDCDPVLTCVHGAGPTAVPEPATLGLLGAGLLLMLLAGCRTRESGVSR